MKVKVIGLAMVIQIFSRTIFIANVMGIAGIVSEIIKTCIIFLISICMTFSEGANKL